jgi:hypothetical protein
MKDTKSFFLDEWGAMGNGTVPVIGCCGFLSGWNETFKVLIPKAFKHDFIDDDSFDLWLEMMNDINLSVKKCKADDKYDVKIKLSF